MAKHIYFISPMVMSLAIVGVMLTVPSHAAMPSDFGLNEGERIIATYSDDPDIYSLNEHGYKRLFINPEIFSLYGHLGGFESVQPVSATVRDAFPTSGLFRNCETNDPKIYGIETTGEDTGILHWVNISAAQALTADSDFFRKVFCINAREFNWYIKGAEYTSIHQIPVYAPRTGHSQPLPTSIPPAPDGLTADAVTYFQIELSWNSVAHATSYALKRTESGANEYIVLAGTIMTNTYTDLSVQAGRTYTYTVTASNAIGESDASTPMSITIPRIPIQGSNVTAPTPAPVLPTCSDSLDNDADGYMDADDPACMALGVEQGFAWQTFQCQDGTDNDGDGTIDLSDADCDSSMDDNESAVAALPEESELLPVEVVLSDRTDGVLGKTATISYMGQIIKRPQAGEIFCTRSYPLTYTSGGVTYTAADATVTYELIVRPGGIDLVCHYTALSSGSLYPYVQIPGIAGTTATGTQYLSTDGTTFLEYPFATVYNVYGSGLYAPVQVTATASYAIGSTLQYPILDYNYFRTEMNSATPHRFTSYILNTLYVSPGDQKTFTYTLRFSSPENWIRTLAPYKRYMMGLYGSDRGELSDRDLHPVNPIFGGASANISESNPYGYAVAHGPAPALRPDTEGFNRFSDWAISYAQSGYFNRTMIWAIGGETEAQYTPQFMFPWNETMQESESELMRIGQAGVKTGFWWGNSRFAVEPFDVRDTYSTSTYSLLDPDNNLHRKKALVNLTLAVSRGATEIGLDAFSSNALINRYLFIKNFKYHAPSVVRFIEEAGPYIDVTQGLKMGGYLQRTNGSPMESASVLQEYLSPGAERWLRFTSSTDVSLENLQTLIDRHYTPVIDEVNLNGVDLRQLNY